MKVNNPSILLTLLFLAFGGWAIAQPVTDWVLKENSDGIRIFTGDAEHSKFKAVKVEFELDATLTQVVATLMDIKGSEEWLYILPAITW